MTGNPKFWVICRLNPTITRPLGPYVLATSDRFDRYSDAHARSTQITRGQEPLILKETAHDYEMEREADAAHLSDCPY